ncbi:hypothetical protein [Klebsiella pneumoniae]|nr:hypothetical protein [Klebsiella pneumoniae]
MLISESAWEEMTCLFAPSLDVIEFAYIAGLLGIEPAPLLQKILVKVAPL